jgi:hypothetical protein
MRHRRRYNVDRKHLTVFLYGDFLEAEKITAQSKTNGIAGGLRKPP